MFEIWKSWIDDPEKRLFDYEPLASASPDVEPVILTAVGVLTGAIDIAVSSRRKSWPSRRLWLCLSRRGPAKLQEALVRDQSLCRKPMT
jgi:hypothetical protein